MSGLADGRHRPGEPAPGPSEPGRLWSVSAPAADASAAVPLNGHRWFPAHLPGKAVEETPPQIAEDFAQKVVTDVLARPAAVEQYRRLAAALHHSQKQFGTKVVMVASAISAEGKSLSICNLALTLSQSYRRRVVLLDGDLRHPGVHEIFQLPATAGLSEALRASSNRALPVFDVTPGLVVVPAGRPDPDPLGGLSSERLGHILDEASKTFDWVLIDTPPIGLVPDAKLLSAFADAVVLVIRAGSSPFVLVQQAIDALGADKVMGVLLNAAEGPSTRQQNGYYGYGYGRNPV